MSFGTYDFRSVDLADRQEIEQVRSFLAEFDLDYDAAQVEYTLVVLSRDTIIATGSYSGEILRNIAVCENLQGEGITAAIVTWLIKEQNLRGRFHHFIYTKPETAALFTSLGFNEIARVETAALLETGLGSIKEYCRDLQAQTVSLAKGNRAAMVVNCNPFTLGHKALITQASKENDAVIVIVVSEERSLFPFRHRMEMIQKGVENLGNVAVVPGEKYVISQATFPAYFTRGEAAVRAQTRLDVTLFANHIAPALSANRRYAGEEPYCAVTAEYNKAMLEILPPRGIEVKVIPRVKSGIEIVSASKIRDQIRAGNWDEVRRLVPQTTYDMLLSEELKPVIALIRSSKSRH